MNKQLVITLHLKAEHIANIYSNMNREGNLNNEKFKLVGIEPTSKTTAILTFQKTSGKLAIAWCYWINCKGGYWEYFFPTESHIFGMNQLRQSLEKIEINNFKLNGC